MRSPKVPDHEILDAQHLSQKKVSFSSFFLVTYGTRAPLENSPERKSVCGRLKPWWDTFVAGKDIWLFCRKPICDSFINVGTGEHIYNIASKWNTLQYKVWNNKWTSEIVQSHINLQFNYSKLCKVKVMSLRRKVPVILRMIWMLN